MAGLKHLTKQDAALLLGKWFSERVQDTRVPGIEGVWALWAKAGLLASLPSKRLLPDVVRQTLRVTP